MSTNIWTTRIIERPSQVIVCFDLNDLTVGSLCLDSLDQLKGITDAIIKVNPRADNKVGS